MEETILGDIGVKTELANWMGKIGNGNFSTLVNLGRLSRNNNTEY